MPWPPSCEFISKIKTRKFKIKSKKRNGMERRPMNNENSISFTPYKWQKISIPITTHLNMSWWTLIHVISNCHKTNVPFTCQNSLELEHYKWDWNIGFRLVIRLHCYITFISIKKVCSVVIIFSFSYTNTLNTRKYSYPPNDYYHHWKDYCTRAVTFFLLYRYRGTGTFCGT